MEKQTAKRSGFQEEQTWQKAILDSADFTIIATDTQGIIQTCNAGALKQLGYTAEEIIGKVTPAIIHDPQEIEQRAQQLSQELGYVIQPGFEVFTTKARLGMPDENLWTYIRKDQSRFPARLSVTALYDEAGNLTGFLGMAKDITEQQQVEQSLRASEARFAKAFEHAAIGMALVSPEGRWLKVNASVCNITGYSESELLALTFQNITHPEDLDVDLETINQLLAGEIDHCHLEKRYIHKQGHEVWISLSVSLVSQEDGSPLHFVAQIQDISQRKQAEADLKHLNLGLEQLVHERTNQLEKAFAKLKISEASYQDLYENAPDMYVSVDAHTSKILQCNQTLCDVLDLGKNELIDRSIFDVYHPDCHSQVEFAFQTFVATGEVQDAQLQLQRKDGSKLDVSLNVRAVRDEAGNVLYSRSSWRDITDRKRLEAQLQQVNTELEQRVQKRTKELRITNQSLRQSQEQLEFALEASGDGWWDWRILSGDMYWSPLFYQMLGFEDGEMPASYETWERLVHPEDLPWVIDLLKAHLQDRSVPYVFDYRVLAKSGQWKWIAAMGKVVEWDAQGQPLRMAGMHHDISERKQAEAERLQAENIRKELTLLEQILDDVLAGYWDWDIPRHHEYLSPGFKRMLGYQDHELPNTPESRQSLIFSEDLPVMLECLDNHFQSRGETPFYHEGRYRHKDGSTVWIISSGQVIEWNAVGQPLRMIGCHVDLSDRILAEEQSRQYAAQLEASNRELEAFAYSVSHDLRAPLRAIDGFSRALLEDYEDLFNDEANDYFDRIRNNVTRMSQLIDGLLDLSRVSRSQIHYTSVNLSTLAQEVIDQLQAAEPERQVNVQIMPDEAISADATLMRVILTNLLQNAWKFTHHHATAHIEFGLGNHKGELTYFVRDDGAGFDMTYAQKLFGVFQRLHSTHEFPGTGIGLASVQRAVHRHGGTVWAEAAPEQGATFYFTVPSSHSHYRNKDHGPTSSHLVSGG
ncbi:PAS domain S-box protein [Acaryochloris sp. 'Moss Beach']|uniref:PAS domain-containing sensor histidine kinase n=1 Tax=Acaryochloris sp. 'Moss Beach' TaxID=2740837 RepID=UPI001F3C4A0A|nr:PAS domain S-box protein [Acaryochloris sp. 'Moss Beach']UJB68495.1 PAS domain S-box protein [Acaryochloris sp. 'Moss Beach']